MACGSLTPYLRNTFREDSHTSICSTVYIDMSCPRTYVEIGVSTGRSLTLALPGTMSVGIDPDPRLSFPLRRGTRIFHQTSDDFFANHDLTRLFGGHPSRSSVY